MTDEKFRPGDRVAEKRKEYTVAEVRNHLWRADDGSIYWRDAQFYELLPAAPAEDTRAALRALDELERMVFNSLPISTEPPAASAHVYFAQLRAALSALPPQAEPVGWVTPTTVERLKMGEGNNYFLARKTANGTHTIPLGYLAPPKPESDWKPTHRHIKRGSEYQLLGDATLQCSERERLSDMDTMVVYRAHDGTLWVRPSWEFNDGRFEALP